MSLVTTSCGVKVVLSLTGQTAPISSMTIYAPPQDGLYRVSAFSIGVAGSSGDGLNWQINMVTDPGSGPIVANSGGYVQQTFGAQGATSEKFALVSSTQPLQLSTAYNSGNPSGFSYDIYVLVESL